VAAHTGEKHRLSVAHTSYSLLAGFVRTITLKQVSVGTELNIVQEGVPAVIPAEAWYLGWQESLTLLAKLVEAEIPDHT
jgi:hypothetical protein